MNNVKLLHAKQAKTKMKKLHTQEYIEKKKKTEYIEHIENTLASIAKDINYQIEENIDSVQSSCHQAITKPVKKYLEDIGYEVKQLLPSKAYPQYDTLLIKW